MSKSLKLFMVMAVLVNSFLFQNPGPISLKVNNQPSQKIVQDSLILETGSIDASEYQYLYHSQPVVFTPTYDAIVVGFRNASSTPNALVALESLSTTTNDEWQVKNLSERGELTIELRSKATDEELLTAIEDISTIKDASFVSPVLEWRDGVKAYFTNEIFIGFVPGTSDALINNFLYQNGLEIDENFGDIANEGVIVLAKSNQTPEKNAFKTARTLTGNSIVNYSLPNLVFWDEENNTSQIDILEDDQPDYEILASSSLPWYVTQIRADEAWSLLSSKASYSVKVAVIDNGVRRNHEAFPAGSIADKGFDAVNVHEDFSAGEPKSVKCDHGTGVAGTIIADKMSSVGYVRGVGDRYVQVVPVNTYDSACITDWLPLIRGINWSIDHAQVLNISLEGPPFQGIDAAINGAVLAGKIVVAAAGNSNQPRVSYPANNPQVIAVGGTGQDGKRWTGSNYGSALSLMAPGSIRPVAALGTVFGPYDQKNGTSFSSPMVAAVSAMMLLANPTLTPGRIKDILQRTAYRDSSYSWDIAPSEGGWNVEMGYGRIDAYKAVEAALYPPKVMISSGGITDDGQIVVTVNNNFHRIVYYNNMVHLQNGNSTWITLNGIAPGTYDFYLKTSRGLRKKITQTLYTRPNQNSTLWFGNIIPGDANNDNIVNLLDFGIWKSEYLDDGLNCAVTHCRSDFDLDSSVGMLDFGYWKAAYLEPPHEGGAGDGWTGGIFATPVTIQSTSPIGSGAAINITEFDNKLPVSGSNLPLSTSLATTGVSFVLYTNNGSPQVGQTINIYAYLDTQGQVSHGASAVLHYDPAVLALQDNDPERNGIQVTEGTTFPQWYRNIQTGSGWIRLGGAGEDFIGADLFFTATFRVISSIPYTGFTITHVPGTVNESLAIEIGSETNLIGNEYYAVLPITGSPARQEPELSFRVPTYFREDKNQICVRVQNAHDTVSSVDLTVTDNQLNSTLVPLVLSGSSDWCGQWDAASSIDQVVHLSSNVYLLGFSRTVSKDVMLDRSAPLYTSHSITKLGIHDWDGARLSVSARDSLTGVKTISAYYNLAPDGSSNGVWVYIGEISGSTGSLTVNTSNLAEGQYRLGFAFYDMADNYRWYSDANNDTFLIQIDTKRLFLPLTIR